MNVKNDDGSMAEYEAWFHELGVNPPSDLEQSLETKDLVSPLVIPGLFSHLSDVSIQRTPVVEFAGSADSVTPGRTIQEVPDLATSPSGECSTVSAAVPPEDSLPLLDRYLGKYNFSVNISPNSKRVPTFSKDLNTFFVQCQNSFAVEFSVRCDGLVPNLHVRAMVCYSDPTYLAEHGPILPCSCNAHTSTRKPEYGNHFIISTSRSARYSEQGGHKTVTVALDDMQIVNGKPTAVYSYASYTSCLGKNAKVSTIFSFMNGDLEVGRDAFYCNVCACPPRDMGKAVLKSKAPATCRRKRKSTSDLDVPASSSAHSPTSPFTPSESASMPLSISLSQLIGNDPDLSPYPDENGYYEFRWRVRDREVFYHLCNVKRSCVMLQNRFSGDTSP